MQRTAEDRRVVINGRFLTEPFSGVQRYAYNLIQEYLKINPDAFVVAPSHSRHFEPLPAERIIQVGQRSGIAWEQWELPRWLRRHGSPLLINLANRAPLLYANQSTVLHDLIPIHFAGSYPLRFRIIFRLLTRFGIVFGRRGILTVSEFSRREIAAYYGIPLERINVISNAGNHIAPLHASSEKLPVERRTYVALARHGIQRNLADVFAAHEEVLSETGLILELVGTGGDVKDLPRTIVRGHISDAALAETLRSALAFVAPSKYEGFDIPPIEAQNLGCVVVASDIPVHREVLGDSALFFNVGDSAELASHLRRLATDPELRQEMQERGSRNSARYSWARSAQALDAVIERRVR